MNSKSSIFFKIFIFVVLSIIVGYTIFSIPTIFWEDGEIILTKSQFQSLNNVETISASLNDEKEQQIKDFVISYKLFDLFNIKNAKVSVVDNQNVYAPQFDEKYNLIIKDFEINDDFNEIYINRFSDKSKYNGKNIFVKEFNAFILCKNKKSTKIIITILKYLLPIFLGILLLLITFEFTTVFIELKRIYYYVTDIKLMLLNLFPIVLLIY